MFLKSSSARSSALSDRPRSHILDHHFFRRPGRQSGHVRRALLPLRVRPHHDSNRQHLRHAPTRHADRRISAGLSWRSYRTQAHDHPGHRRVRRADHVFLLHQQLRNAFWLRLIDGIPLGGMLPLAWALNIEYAPKRYRATIVTANYGRLLARHGARWTWFANWLIPKLGWKSVFISGVTLSAVARQYDSRGIVDVLNWMERALSCSNKTGRRRIGCRIHVPGITSATLYQQRGLYWYRTDGKHGESLFPLYEKWAIIVNTKPELVTGPALPQGALADYGNDPRGGVRVRVQSSDGRQIQVGSELGCKLNSDPLVVRDTREGREMTTDPSTLPADFEATFTGVRRWPNSDLCSASIMWATAE